MKNLGGLIGVLVIFAIFGVMPLVQGLYFLIATKEALYLDRWRWYIGIPSALYLLWFFFVLAK